jgi:hypothetical protein
MPLLVVFVFGIFDFGQAFNLKQKLSAAAQQGAQFASSLPSSDLTASGTPPSISSIHDLVDGYLQGAGVNDCGLGGATAAPSGTLQWTYTASLAGCPAPFNLVVERGYSFPVSIPGGGGNMYVVSSRVTLIYPYQWRFSNVIQLIAPGASYAGTSFITTDAVVPNQ